MKTATVVFVLSLLGSSTQLYAASSDAATLILFTHSPDGGIIHTSQARFDTAAAAEKAGIIAQEAAGWKTGGSANAENGWRVWVGPWVTYRVVPAKS